MQFSELMYKQLQIVAFFWHSKYKMYKYEIWNNNILFDFYVDSKPGENYGAKKVVAGRMHPICSGK